MTSERNKSSNVQVSRVSLYAADAGVSTAQQVMNNAVQARLDSVSAAWSGSGANITDPGTFFSSMPTTITTTGTDFNASISVAFHICEDP